MSKNKLPEYFMWGCYFIISAVYMAAAAAGISAYLGFGYAPGIAAAVILTGLVGMAVKSLHKLFEGKSFHIFLRDRRLVCLTAEGVLLVLLLSGMILMRSYLQWEVAGSGVYEAAWVTNDGFLPAYAHGGYRVYLYLLHFFLLLLGNKTYAAVLLQLILLAGAAVSIYFGVRRISGVGAAMLTVIFLGYAPCMLDVTCSLNPFLLFVFCYGLALNSIGVLNDSMATSGSVADQIIAVLFYVLSGALIGFCCYLDIAGITLLIVLTGVVCFGDYMGLREDKYGDDFNWFSEIMSSPAAVFLTVFIISAFSFWQFHGSFASIAEQLVLYVPDRFFPERLFVGVRGKWELVVVATFAVAGVFCFWYGRKMGRRVVWLFSEIVVIAMICVGINAPEFLDGTAVCYILSAILAGSGLEDIFKENSKKEDTLTEFSVTVIDMDKGAEEQSDKKEQEIHFIENPLPLPKKRERKVMDYDYEVADDDDFDI